LGQNWGKNLERDYQHMKVAGHKQQPIIEMSREISSLLVDILTRIV
jgi:hypothetical protein